MKVALYLQKGLKDRGISYRRNPSLPGMLRISGSLKVEKFEKTEVVIPSSLIKEIVKHSKTIGHPPEQSVTLFLGGDGKLAGHTLTYSIGVRLKDPKVASALATALKKRYKLDLPVTLNLAHHEEKGNNRLYVDVDTEGEARSRKKEGQEVVLKREEVRPLLTSRLTVTGVRAATVREQGSHSAP